MRCSSCEPLLDAYLEATLALRQARAVAAHLHACSDCMAFLRELRVVDALLTTAHPPAVGTDFTAAVVGATQATAAVRPRRVSIGLTLLLYLALAWALVFYAAFHGGDLGSVAAILADQIRPDAAALIAAARALAPATPFAAAIVSGVLVLDAFLLGALVYGYRRLRPAVALYLARGSRT